MLQFDQPPPDETQEMTSSRSFTWDTASLRPDVLTKAPDVLAKASDLTSATKDHRHTYASFGDGDTTVSVNAYGHIMQICRYFGIGSSGFFCVDLEDYSEPYMVQDRMNDLIASSMTPDQGLRLDIAEWTRLASCRPDLGFVYDRWPRYDFEEKPDALPEEETETKNTSPFTTEASSKSRNTSSPLSIQYYCSQGTVFQTYILQSHGSSTFFDKEKVEMGKIQLQGDICIRTLSFTISQEFDEYPWRNVDKFVVGKHHLFLARLVPDEIVKQKASRPPESMWEGRAYIVLEITPFVNGQHVEIDEEYWIQVHNDEIKTQFEITISYKLRLLDESQLQNLKASKTPEEVGGDRDLERDQRRDQESPISGASDQAQRSTEAVPVNAESPKVGHIAVAHQTKSTLDQLDGGSSLTLGTRLVQSDGLPALLGTLSTSPAVEGMQQVETITDTPVASSGGGVGGRVTRMTNGYARDVLEETEQALEISTNEFSDNFKNYRKIAFSKDKSLDYVFRRHLEHVLSVCSIPVGDGKFAITCGDISGHRIGPRASSSAVQFLSSVLTHLDKLLTLNSKLKSAHNAIIQISTSQRRAALTSMPVDVDKRANQTEAEGLQIYIEQLQKRIFQVLRGHVLWICHAAKAGGSNMFSANYWPTGCSIEDTYYLPPPSLIDTPLQLLKISTYLDIRTLKDEPALVQDNLRTKVDAWIKELHRLNVRGSYAFFRSLEDPDSYAGGEELDRSPKYRLTDHVMIGMALHCIEKLKDTDPEYSNIAHLCYYPYEEVRCKILKRFTVENPISKQRMLATSRWTDETRFLFHSKDTYLFHAADMNFFDRSRKISSSPKTPKHKKKGPRATNPWRHVDDHWTKTLDAQAYHDEYQQLDWHKPLWYALVLALTSKGRRLNDDPCEVLLDQARTTLLTLASYNGLFPGSLDQSHVSAIHSSESERDDYWFATFEIPCILWSSDPLNDSGSTSWSSSRPLDPFKPSGAAAKDSTRIGQQVEKHVTFTKLGTSKDEFGLVTLSDDWLQCAPLERKKDSDAQNTKDNEPHGSKASKSPDEILKGIPLILDPQLVGIVIDIPKWSLGTEISQNTKSAKAICAEFPKQDSWLSKKRIVWLSGRDKGVMRKCLETSLSQKKADVLSFFERHVNSERYFFDSATAAANDWETELHLSFYRISKDSQERSRRLGSLKHLALTTMSFRFSGDFSDRSWICYFLEHGTEKDKIENLGLRLKPSPKSGFRDGLGLLEKHVPYTPSERRAMERYSTKPWQQRQVLELLIYSKMLSKMRKNTSELFRNIRAQALRSKSEFQKKSERDPFKKAIQEARQLQRLANEEDYLATAAHWRGYAPILLVIEENLMENLVRIKEWQQRKEDRQSQQPRWTKRDEQNHRTTIAKLSVYTERQARELERLKDQLGAFRESLPSQLDSLREDINFRGSQNINLFTYVTVVFLPLGFATGILSMNGPPDASILTSLVHLSLAALGTTLFVLLNARTGRTILTPFIWTYRTIKQMLWQLCKFAFFFSVGKVLLRLLAYYTKHWDERNLHERARETAPSAPKTPGQVSCGRSDPATLMSRPMDHKSDQQATTFEGTDGNQIERLAGRELRMLGQQQWDDKPRHHDLENAPGAHNENQSRVKRWRDNYKEYMSFSLREKLSVEVKRLIPDLEDRKGSFWAYLVRKRPPLTEDGLADSQARQESEEEND